MSASIGWYISHKYETSAEIFVKKIGGFKYNVTLIWRQVPQNNQPEAHLQIDKRFTNKAFVDSFNKLLVTNNEN